MARKDIAKKDPRDIDMKTETRKVDKIKFREDLYPRIKKDPALVQQYAEVLDILPPIEVNQHDELIDGWHRWTGHKEKGLDTIAVKVTETKSDAEFLALACRRNATAGKQLEDRDKRKMAIRLYNGGEGIEKPEIADVLSVTPRAVSGYLKDIEDQLKKDRRERIFDLWLACWTQQAIAEEVGVDQDTVSAELQDLRKMETLPKSVKSAIQHADDFDPKLYSVWNIAKCSNKAKVFGSIPQEILDNLLYYYTKPFDVVFDPFGGGGMTIDVCRKRLRRYFVTDLNPIEARADELSQHDITTGLPDGMPVPDLVFLDPPYWKQARHQYSKKKTDLGNVSFDAFLNAIGGITKAVKRKWNKKHNGVLALIIGPCQHGNTETDLAFHCYQVIAKYLKPLRRIIVPYSTDVHGGAYVDRAKKDRQLLYLHRDLMLFGYDNGLPAKT